MPRCREHLEPAELTALFGNVTILKGLNETLLEHLDASRQVLRLARFLTRRPPPPDARLQRLLAGRQSRRRDRRGRARLPDT
eukprot:909719-Prymnesium_polylepis.1